jgi:hypothetical protein
MSAPINLRLLSPQSAADKTGPLLSFEDSITIPIYSTQTFDLSGSISDISGIERVYLDADVNDDEDGDGIPDNDDSLRIAGSSSPDRFGIRATRDIGVFRFGPYTQPFARDMLVFAEDMNGNISSRDLRLVVTTPSIEISSATG